MTDKLEQQVNITRKARRDLLLAEQEELNVTFQTLPQGSILVPIINLKMRRLAAQIRRLEN